MTFSISAVHTLLNLAIQNCLQLLQVFLIFTRFSYYWSSLLLHINEWQSCSNRQVSGSNSATLPRFKSVDETLVCDHSNEHY